MNVQVRTKRARADEAIAIVTAQTVERCQVALGDSERVLFATGATDGPNPVWRILLLGSAGLGVAAPGGLAVQVPATVVAAVVVWAITGIWWKRRLLARTALGLVAFELKRGRQPGAVVGRSTDLVPAHSKDIWRGFAIDGHVYWVSKRVILSFVVPA